MFTDSCRKLRLRYFTDGFKREADMSDKYEEEVGDLKKIYEDTLKKQQEWMDDAMHPMIYQMREYIKAYDSYVELSNKLHDLKDKMQGEEEDDD